LREKIIEYFFRFFRKKQDVLKRETHRRFSKNQLIWASDYPRIIKEEDLQLGDVLFCGPSIATKLSEIIQHSTDGPYTHCAIYCGDKIGIVEVAVSGIKSSQYNEFVSRYKYITATRHFDLSTNYHKMQAEAILCFVEKQLNKKIRYNWLGAAMVPMREYYNIRWFYNSKPHENILIKKTKTNTYFCSQFVVDCYKACGYISNDKYMDSRKWSPNSLAEENIFKLVGFLTKHSYKSISENDPYLNGFNELFTEEGKANSIDLKKLIEDIKINRNLLTTIV
jgi:hypothetical protein